MAANIQLMLKDTVVMEINFDEVLYDVKKPELLPFELRGCIQDIGEVRSNLSKYEVTQMLVKQRKNYDAIIGYLAYRVLPITRENAKKVYNLFNFEQVQGEPAKARIAIICRALSLQDNFWLRVDNSSAAWDSVNLRKISLSEAVAQVSLHGTSFTLTNKKEEAMRTPDLTGQGSYAKAWVREPGGLYLYKRGSNGVMESKIEVMVSGLLDNCNVDHLKYEAVESNGEYVCKCKCMTHDTISILPGMDFHSYCNRRGLDSREEALKIDAEAIYKMWIVDYLISNRDRHGLNWGFFYNCDTMEILGCHPLYDHNKSFYIAYMQDEDAEYLYDNRMTMKEAAKIAMRKVDFHFYREFTREDFLTDRQYHSFMKRASELGIQIKPRA